jgi:predicted PurR-regulated permease PerM
MAQFDHNEPPRQPDEEGLYREDTVSINGKRLKKRTVFYIVATIIALLLFAFAVHEPMIAVFKYILSILSPLIIGMVIAYLCDPILEFFEYRIFKRLHNGSLKRGLSLFFTIIVAFGIVTVVAVMMIPQLYLSITELFQNSETYINSLLSWLQTGLNKLTANLPMDIVDISDVDKLMVLIENMFGSAENALSELISELQDIASEGNLWERVWTMLLSLFNSVKNLFIGLFIAFYTLASKEKRVAQIRKFRKAMLSEKSDGKVEDFIALADKTFGGFIFGKILDSLVIGVLTFVLLSIFEVSPYNMLIATFVGLTNVIPVFGPFIGAIPSFFVVLISNPGKAILFLVLILIIQQLDGNIIGPKILGDNTGVSSLCVIIAIAVCSAMWGVVGMIIGVPIFAVVIEMMKRTLEKKLAAKGEPTDTMAYYPADAVGNAEKDVYYEHSTLRYNYEHSKLKPRLEKLRNSILNHLGRQAKPGKNDAPAPRNDTDPTAPKDGDTES